MGHSISKNRLFQIAPNSYSLTTRRPIILFLISITFVKVIIFKIWRAANFILNVILMVFEQWVLFSVPQLTWPWPTLTNPLKWSSLSINDLGLSRPRIKKLPHVRRTLHHSPQLRPVVTLSVSQYMYIYRDVFFVFCVFARKYQNYILTRIILFHLSYRDYDT